jgi:hypothetical protein
MPDDITPFRFTSSLLLVNGYLSGNSIFQDHNNTADSNHFSRGSLSISASKPEALTSPNSLVLTRYQLDSEGSDSMLNPARNGSNAHSRITESSSGKNAFNGIRL